LHTLANISYFRLKLKVAIITFVLVAIFKSSDDSQYDPDGTGAEDDNSPLNIFDSKESHKRSHVR
jgi:hypothetical protein